MPVEARWRRSEERQDDEVEQRGRVGLVITAIVILFLLCLPFILSLTEIFD